MTEIRHIPAPGQSLIAGGHNTQKPLECPCNPTRTLVYKKTALGRFGRHQGTQVIKIEWRHNVIEREEPTEAPRPAGELYLFADDRAFAAREDVALAKLAS